MKRKITYILLLLVTLTAAVTGEGEFPRFLFAFEVLFGLAMAVWVHWMIKKLCVKLSVSPETIFRGDTAEIRAEIKNPSFFPASDIQLTLEIRELTGEKDRRREAVKRISGHTGADKKGTDTWKVPVQPVHTGVLSIRVVEIRLFDYMGLFSAKGKKKPQGCTAAVLPRIYPMEIEGETGGLLGNREIHEAVAAETGTDSQEIFDTRLYQRGDMLKNIHWKLSAKGEDLMVKEFSKPLDLAVPVFLDCTAEKPEQVTPAETDSFLELGASLGYYFTEHKKPFEFQWFSKNGQGIRKCRVEGEASLYAALEEILEIRPCTAGETGGFKGHGNTEGIRISMDSRLYHGTEELAFTMEKNEKAK